MLRSVAQHTLQLHPGLEFKGERPRIQVPNTTTNDNTSRPFIRFLFERKELGEGSGAAGYITPEIFEDKNLDPPTFVSKSKRLGGYTQ